MTFAAGLVFICLLSWPAFALDVTMGDTWTCAKWLEARDELKNWRRHPSNEIPRDTYVPSAWLIGFLEGYDRGCLTTSAVGLDTEGVFERVDSFCRSAKPDTPLHLAASNLIEQLHPETGGACLH